MIYLNSVEALYKHLREAGVLNCAYPNLILIGGCSRSGKSTVAAKLAKKLSGDKVANCTVKLDSWLVSLEKRRAASKVMERYESKKIIHSLKDILKGEVVYPPVYDVNSRRRIAEHGSDGIFIKDGVVIAEGIIALALEKLMDKALLKIFVSVPDRVRIKRLKYFY
ncbi:MAG: AAA family ATPase, partial [Candidatus Omnitrophota bacterium]